jgi:hypothetical protein
VLVVVGILVFGGNGEPEIQPTRPPTRPPSPTIDTSARPVLLSPADGAVFGMFPRTTVYRWQPVPGAT